MEFPDPPIDGGGPPLPIPDLNRRDSLGEDPPPELGNRDVPRPDDHEVDRDLKKSGVSHVLKTVGKFIWNHKVLFTGLGIGVAGGAILVGCILLAPVPSISLLILGVGLMVGGLTLAIWSGPVESKVNKVTDKGFDLAKKAVKNVADTNTARNIQEYGRYFKQKVWESIDERFGNGAVERDDFDFDAYLEQLEREGI